MIEWDCAIECNFIIYAVELITKFKSGNSIGTAETLAS